MVLSESLETKVLNEEEITDIRTKVGEYISEQNGYVNSTEVSKKIMRVLSGHYPDAYIAILARYGKIDSKILVINAYFSRDLAECTQKEGMFIIDTTTADVDYNRVYDEHGKLLDQSSEKPKICDLLRDNYSLDISETTSFSCSS